MNYLIILLLISACSYDRGGSAKDSYYITTSEATTELTTIIDEVNSGARAIFKKDCKSISHTSDANTFSVTADGTPHTILLNNQTIDSNDYLESVCKKLIFEDEVYAITCSARRADLDDTHSSKSFYIKYGTIGGFKALYECN